MSKCRCLVLSAVILAGCAGAPRPVPAPEPVPETRAAVPAPPAETSPAPAAEPAPQPAAAAEPEAGGLPSPGISADALGLYRTPEELAAPPSSDELAVIASAKLLLGKAPSSVVVVKGKRFVLDCIGTVSAIYWQMNIDVQRDFGKYTGNGVNRLYMTLLDRGVLHTDSYPRPGDVIIWDNTWDANGNGDRTDDLRTHAGIVLAVDQDGTIHYVHENLYKGVVIEVMNLLQPAVARDGTGKQVNSGMAIATVTGGPRPDRWLSGDVFGAFGDVLGMKDDFMVAGAAPFVVDAAASTCVSAQRAIVLIDDY